VTNRVQQQYQADAVTGGQPTTDADAAALEKAVANPGAVEITDEPPRTTPPVEIPSENLTPSAGFSGQRLEANPATMMAEVSRPGPQSWIALLPDRTLRTVMLAHKPQRNGSPNYLWVAPDLRGQLQKYLKQVCVHLVFDTGGQGEPFLWIVPETAFSPYFAAVSDVLSRGPEFVRKHLFQFVLEAGARRVEIGQREWQDDDPEMVLPSRPVGQLLPEALKAERLILTTDHPVYRALTMGRRMA
jgi:hypothetical protein